MTLFENVTRALARQLNPRGDLTPLDSLIDFQRFHPFCLVLRKRKSTIFWGARYVRTDYTLLDVLEPGSSPSGQPPTGSTHQCGEPQNACCPMEGECYEAPDFPWKLRSEG